MKRTWITGIVLVAVAAVFGCSKGQPRYRAELEILLLADVSNPLPLEDSVSTNWVGEQLRLFESEALLGSVVDELKLPVHWSMSRLDAVARLKSSLAASPRRLTLTLTNEGATTSQEVDALHLAVIAEGADLSEQIVLTLAGRFKTKAEELAGKQITEQIARAEKALEAAQEKFNALNAELQQMQTNTFVPSRYKLSKEYEAELQARIRDATKEETDRVAQLDALRKLPAEELRAALVKIELARLASPEIALNPSAATSMLLTVHQAQKTATEELALAKRGALNETNAVAHAELKLEQANRNLTNTVDAYFKSLDIGLEVARTRRQEYAASLENLKELAVRSQRKEVIEKDKHAVNAQMTRLGLEIERWKIGQRILSESIKIGPVRVSPVSAR
jgi:hypothetical protein